MKIQQISTKEGLQYDAIGLMLFKDYDETLLSEGLQKQLSTVISNKVFDLSSGKSMVFYCDETVYLVSGLGSVLEDFDLEDLRLGISIMMKDANAHKIKTIALYIQHNHIEPHHMYAAIAQMALFSSYQFDRYKSEKTPFSVEELYIVDTINNGACQEGIEEGILLGEATSIARELVDEPACAIYPQALATRALTFGEQYGFEVEIIDQEAIQELGMHAFLAVSRASSHQPKLIVMRYRGNVESEVIEGWVGKGLTYDSGGLSIKTADGMETMKTDMGGAAAVIGAMTAIAKAKLKINVTAVVAACENMISGNSYKPGDILQTMGGKTIYIGNTDAEGRLTLVDAITYIVRKEGVSSIVDLATLTGAAIMSLGNVSALSVTNDDELYTDYEHAARLAGEKVWRMPTFKAYNQLIKHHEADLTNMGGKPGSITAALVLKEFVEDKPWVHVDIAGVAHYTTPLGYYPKGASGYGVKTLYELAKLKLNKLV
jgi:leucyl aminopeptidase